MKRTILFFSFIGCCFAIFSQNQICVDGSASGSENGTPSNPYHTIQAAVNKAVNSDIIKVAKGTYSEAVQIVEKKVQLLGGFAGSGDFNSANPEINKTIIKGRNNTPCVLVNIQGSAISGSLIIKGFIIREGERGIELANGWSESMDNITIENNIIENNGTNNAGQYGGGISFGGSNVTIKNNIIRNNKSGHGAAIGRTDRMTNFIIADNLIENNTGYGDHAGGVDIQGTGTITRNIFDGNVAAKDLSYGWGGAILITNYDTTKLITLSHNVYRNNHAPDRGGAVFVDDGSKVRMEHELFYNNTTKKSGSAIYVDSDGAYNPSVLYMNNCTVSGNSTDGAALFVQSSIAHIQDCIFWNNGSDFEVIADGHLTVNYTLTQQGFTGTGNISPDPLFANASNGDFHVKSKNGRFDPATGQFVNDDVSSPAIDAGNPSSPFSNEPAPNGDRVNVGCYGNTAEASKSAVAGIENNTQVLWTIFPNPAKENITIAHLPGGSTVNIMDITGKKVHSSVIENEQITISTVNFENGVYIVQVINNGGVAYRKLVVKR
ncbi:MAG: T9SS type A sorting domain-containing protein [Bacteroidetes bacterium]|nr:T9SS type A sorting domain-containing protein [Bacteroidota bacterium]MCL1968468.1 T9SS type A sorting domain-containing protein [Bacteroidota bacterium]